MIRWSDELMIGIPRIDLEHQILLGMVNDFEQARLEGAREELLQEHLQEISAFAKYQFLHEENMLARSCFSDLKIHCHKHAQFMDMIFNISLSRQVGLTRFSDVGDRLSKWIVEHIKEDDAKYARVEAPSAFSWMIDDAGDIAQQIQKDRHGGAAMLDGACLRTSDV